MYQCLIFCNLEVGYLLTFTSKIISMITLVFFFKLRTQAYKNKKDFFTFVDFIRSICSFYSYHANTSAFLTEVSRLKFPECHVWIKTISLFLHSLKKRLVPHCFLQLSYIDCFAPGISFSGSRLYELYFFSSCFWQRVVMLKWLLRDILNRFELPAQVACASLFDGWKMVIMNGQVESTNLSKLWIYLQNMNRFCQPNGPGT